jgi:transcriptional regulator with XRE-family HTH domain
MDMDTIGKRIAHLRKDKSLTQQELADLINVSDKTISKWENDLSLPGIDILPNLVEKLDTSLDYLVVGTNDDKKNTFDTNDSANIVSINIKNKIYIYIGLALFLLLIPFIVNSIGQTVGYINITVFMILISLSFFGIIFLGIFIFNSYNVYKKIYKIKIKSFMISGIILLSIYFLSLAINTTNFVNHILRNEYYWFWNILWMMSQALITVLYIFLLIKFIKKCKEEN